VKNIGNVINTGTFIDNSRDNGRLLRGADKGTINSENGDKKIGMLMILVTRQEII
jgi:hypothetical protein